MEAIITKNKAVIAQLEKSIAESPVIKAAKDNAVPLKGRKLTDKEVQLLKQNGNFSCDWGAITVSEDFIPDNIFTTYLHGNVYLGKLAGYEGDKWYGIASSGIYNSDILDNVTIVNARSIANYRIKSGAVLNNVGTLEMSGKSSFGIGVELPIAIETGGREVLTYPEITVDVAATIATGRTATKLLSRYGSLIEQYKEEAASSKGTVEANAVIKNAHKIVNAYIGEGALIDNPTLLKDSTVYSLTDEVTEISDGAYVSKSIVQWGAEVTSMAIVDKSVLTEHSHVERHGKLTESLIGPNTGIAEGEVTACLVGPFVGFHHQSLLIAAYWPEGKGNIGYGANVGSNHTSKAPDQELWAGEGLFYGLSVNIKYPSDYSRAAYSIIATGVSALPQKMEFPFSLVNTRGAIIEGISPAYNELIPGWVLSDNIYVIKRNEGKYIKRNKAKRSELVLEVFRPDIIKLMEDARARLHVSKKKDVYTSKDIEGLGKNYMFERSRLNGIAAYTFYIQYYALTGLYKAANKMIELGKQDRIKSLLSDDSLGCDRWQDERRVLLKELPAKTMAEYFELLSEMEEKIAQCVLVSKQKDDRRGIRIIPDYADAHKPAEQDGFVKETLEKTVHLRESIKKLIDQL